MTYKQEFKLIVDKLKNQLIKTRKESKATKKDIGVVLGDYLNPDGDYTLTFQTKLYNKHGGEYCSLLEILNEMNIRGLLEGIK